MEPIYIFIRDDVAKAMIGPKYERFMPFLMSIFFFILVLNLVGQIPFVGNPNVTGNLAVTLVLALFTFFITNLNGNKHYWQHIFWMPGIPWAVKILMTPIEILGLFLKPITLMVRLFANITAGHIVVLSFVGLIFIFGEMGQNAVGGYGGAVVSVLLTLFMSAIELLVAFIQAFIFAILSASYIGMAVADDHH
jgi:F-type H+-transporting ATPase subunit a